MSRESASSTVDVRMGVRICRYLSHVVEMMLIVLSCADNALAVASKNLNTDHRPDFTNTEPAANIGPFPQWSDPKKIVAMDPLGTRFRFDTDCVCLNVDGTLQSDVLLFVSVSFTQ